MKIGIDARWIFRETSGISVYTTELIRQLAQIDRQNHYLIFFNEHEPMQKIRAEIEAAGAANFKPHLLDCGIFSIRNQLKMPGIIRALGLDVFHSTNYMIPLLAFPRHQRGKTACVTTMHDLIPLLYPEATPRSRKTRFFPIYCRLMKEIALRSKIIITDSRSSRADIIARLPCRLAQVMAIGLGVNPRFKPPDASSANTRFSRREKRILWVGRQDPYKNLTGLIEAFALLRKTFQGEVTLRLVGPPDARYPEPFRQTKKLGLTDVVKWTGHISDDELVKEYQDADVFILPSLYEGFGLPVLEAFACGTPVICSNCGSLPDTCGQAALQIDPHDTAGICEAMRKVLMDTCFAGELIKRGHKQAAKFSWQETARQTIMAYEQAVMQN